MDNAQAKSPSFPMGHSFVEKAVNVLDYMRIGPGQSPPKKLEEIFANFGRELDQWWEHQRQSLASPVLPDMASPIDPLAVTIAQPVVLPGPVPIDIPPAPVEIPTPEPPDPNRMEAEPLEETPDPDPEPPSAPWTQPGDPPPPPEPVSAPPKPEKAKEKKQEKTAAEKEHEKQVYKIRKAFQQRNYQLKKQGKPPLPQPASWDTLLSQKDDTPEVDAGPNGSEDG